MEKVPGRSILASQINNDRGICVRLGIEKSIEKSRGKGEKEKVTPDCGRYDTTTNKRHW